MFNKVRKIFMVYYDIQNTDSHSPNYTHTHTGTERQKERGKTNVILFYNMFPFLYKAKGSQYTKLTAVLLGY